jgi:hypothetical protein
MVKSSATAFVSVEVESFNLLLSVHGRVSQSSEVGKGSGFHSRSQEEGDDRTIIGGL